MADLGSGAGGDAEEGTVAPEEPPEKGIDEPVMMRKGMRLGPFQMQILECMTTLLLGETAHVMVVPLKAGTVQPAGACPLPPGLNVLHVYTRLKMGSNKVSVIVHNMSDNPIFLKKGVQVAHVSASVVPSAKLSPEMEAALEEEAQPEPMSVAACQEKLLEKLNLDGLRNWTPQNAAGTRELILAFHNILCWMAMSSTARVPLNMRFV